MKTRRIRRISAESYAGLLLAALVLLALPATPARAHPHFWIGVETAVVFDETGQMVALDQTWRFDPLYSSFAVMGLERDEDRKPLARALATLAADSLASLAPFGYFSRVEVAGEPVSIRPPDEIVVRMEGSRLVFAFRLPLVSPLQPAGEDVRYAIYDPSFYIEMLHEQGAASVALVGASGACRAALAPPTPDADARAMAAALDARGRADGDLGVAFAEWVSVSCD